MRTVAALTCSLLALLAAPAGAAVGELRVLVVPLTWGPALPAEQELRLALDDADAFFRRASFGRASISATIAQPVTGFVVPPSCFAGANEDTGLGAVALAARTAAARGGHDLGRYDRFVYVFPDRVCGSAGLGSGRDVLLAGGIGGLVHELGHTFRLPHAGSAACATCAIREYGDPVSVMGHGSTDFSAWEKAQLGWLGSTRRVTANGTFALAPVDAAPAGPQALLLRTAVGTLWIERRLSPAPRLELRVVKRPRGGGATRTVLLASGRTSATVRGLVRVTRTAGGVALFRLDRRR
jgi:hypothetical protein